MSRGDAKALSPDVLVLGGGAAGLCAAVAARKAGASVVVLKKSEGATALSSGAIDVADADRDLVPGAGASPLARGPKLSESVTRLASERPRHPYARLQASGRDRMTSALALLEHIAAPLELHGAGDGNVVVATQLGSVKRSARVQRSQAFDLASLDEGARVAVLELEDLAGYDGAPVAKVLSWIDGMARGGSGSSASGTGSGGARRFDVVTVRAAEGRRMEASARAYAANLDESGAESLLERVTTALRLAASDGGGRFTCALLPPVLGLDVTRPLAERLSEAAGVPVVEVLALPQSAPGQRLSAALAFGAEREGVRVVKSDALSSLVEGGRVLEVRAREGGEDVLYRPRAVVLATGRFLAGGLVRDGYAIEPVFGLPLFTDGALVGDRYIGSLTADRPEGEHAIFRAGVGYNERLQPTGDDGAVLAQNLYACGSILEGYDPARDGSGLGVAALTGLVAGELAAEISRP